MRHSSLTGFVAERPVPTGGEVVLIDGNRLTDIGPGELEARWIVRHVPSGNQTYFVNEKVARKALKALSEGIDEWGILPPDAEPSNPSAPALPDLVPATSETTMVVEDDEPDDGPAAESFRKLARRRGIYGRHQIISKMWEIATDAVVAHNGEEVIDYKTRLAALDKIARYEFGDPGAPDPAEAGQGDAASYRDRYARVEWSLAVQEILAKGGTIEQLLPVFLPLLEKQKRKNEAK